MSRRSELREAAMERFDHRCQWPECGTPHEKLEMAHLQQLSQGGLDVIENVVILCRHHHDVLDNRTVWKRRQAVVDLLKAFLDVVGPWRVP